MYMIKPGISSFLFLSEITSPIISPITDRKRTAATKYSPFSRPVLPRRLKLSLDLKIQ